MANGNPLKWKLKLTAELVPGEYVECDVAEWARGEEVTLGSLGLSIAEGKSILAEVQMQMVAAQIERHGQARRAAATADGNCPTRAIIDRRFVPCSETCLCEFGA